MGWNIHMERGIRRWFVRWREKLKVGFQSNYRAQEEFFFAIVSLAKNIDSEAKMFSLSAKLFRQLENGQFWEITFTFVPFKDTWKNVDFFLDRDHVSGMRVKPEKPTKNVFLFYLESPNLCSEHAQTGCMYKNCVFSVWRTRMAINHRASLDLTTRSRHMALQNFGHTHNLSFPFAFSPPPYACMLTFLNTSLSTNLAV